MSRHNRDRAAQNAAAQANEAASEAGRTLRAQRNYGAAPEQSEPVVAEYVPPTEREPAAPIVPRNEPRRLAMDEVVARHERTLGPAPEEPAPKPAKEVKPAPEPEIAPTKIDAAPQPAGDPPIEPATVETAKTVKVKVDGEEFDVPESDVEEAGGIKSYQRDRASENRLKKANEALAVTRQTQAQIAAWVEQQAKANTPPPKTNTQMIQESIDTIRFGSAEDAAAAFQKVLDQQRVDEKRIIGQSVAVFQQQQAEEAFVKDNADIVQNPLLLKVIIGMKQERLANNQGTSDWSKFYKDIGNEVRGAFGRQSQPAPAPAVAEPTTGSTSTVTSEKEARKASIVNLPTAAARAALPEADKPESREETILQMRKARGLPTG